LNLSLSWSWLINLYPSFLRQSIAIYICITSDKLFLDDTILLYFGIDDMQRRLNQSPYLRTRIYAQPYVNFYVMPISARYEDCFQIFYGTHSDFTMLFLKHWLKHNLWRYSYFYSSKAFTTEWNAVKSWDFGAVVLWVLYFSYDNKSVLFGKFWNTIFICFWHFPTNLNKSKPLFHYFSTR
jgi:hypothetical protein